MGTGRNIPALFWLIGSLKPNVGFLEEFVGPRMIQLYKSIKLAFDDKLILNPGKVIEFNK